MNVRIAGGDRPVRAHGTPLSPMGLLPASDNAKWVGMLVSFALGLILSTAHIAGSPAPFGLAFLAAMLWIRRRTVPCGVCTRLFCRFRRRIRHAACSRVLPDFFDGVFSAQPSVCADALVSAARLRSGLHTDAPGAVSAHGRRVTAADIAHGAVSDPLCGSGLRL